MSFASYADGSIQLQNPRISARDAERQARAARELLARFARQPGVILADEVGMGKTFVALAVAASILIDREDAGPVVVMTPPSLRYKWPKDWNVFRSYCLSPELQNRFRAGSADSGVDFLRLLDNPPERRTHVIFLTHGALNRSIGDGFAKLAVVKRAFKGRSSLADQRRNFGRFAGQILRMEWYERHAEGVLGDLLDRDYDSWLRALHRASDLFKTEVTDEPVPAAFAGALDEMESHYFEPIVEALRAVPLRESARVEERLKDVRKALAQSMEEVWQLALSRCHFRSPLLVLDEAHHVKNPETKLASLFVNEEFDAESNLTVSGPLANKFDRMLFLTATPFQLGHGELIRVLERFEGVDWRGSRAPSLTREQFKAELAVLASTLDDAQSAALRLDGAWGRLTAEHVGIESPTDAEIESWWAKAGATEGEGILAQVVQQVRYTGNAMKKAELGLAPWVLRHVRPAALSGDSSLPRREVRTGDSILSDQPSNTGLEITPQTLLPFLLAGRAQALLAASNKGRALFADGLASSFEAYLETRSGQLTVDEDADAGAAEAGQAPELQWYLGHLDKALPKDSRSARSAHPKVLATTKRAIQLWKAGEKVLIFCHYRATGRALRQHISARLHQEILSLGAQKLPGRSTREVQTILDELGDQFFKDEKLRAAISASLESIVAPFAFSSEERELVVEVVRRFLRTPSFLVRYFPLEEPDRAAGMVRALEQRQGGESLRERVENFCRFLAERCTPEERREFVDALLTVQTGTQFGKEVRAVFDPAEGASDEAAMLLPNVRLANGEVRQETRRTLLLTFNTPLFPEILIASSVLAEGVDLHLHCRYVIHHDLCWNPSTLEQRSGRVDRIGCLAERVRQSINLYLPYVAATQDEKMFRVVRDRERWFQIVMGEKYEVDESTTDRRAARIALPEAVRSELALKLHS
ncbi:MAG TPA: helicase-related protein [Burkholderiales bacterium]|nr:helicase-related protein [Burkholderiales bacterium]